VGGTTRASFVGVLGRRFDRWIIPVLAFMALAAPASAQAHGVEVLTETEKSSALKFAEVEGTVSSLEAEHSSSTLAAAEQISGETQPASAALTTALAMTSTPVDVEVLHGQFVESNFPTPQGSPTPEGTVLELVTNRLTGEVVASRLGDSTTTTLTGEVQRQSFKSTVAQIARLTHLRALVQRRRTRSHKSRRDARAANWGTENRCGDEMPEHCYAVARWVMEGGSEKVQGSQFKVLLREAGVPSGGEAFVDEEEWVEAANGQEGAGGWAEAGVIQELDRHALYSFWAYKSGKGALVKFIGPPYTGEVNAGEFVNFALMASGNQVWCLYAGPNWEIQVYCMNTGFTYSTRLTDGSEMATNTMPEVAGTAESNYEALNGELRNWNKATDVSVTEEGEHLISEICEWNIGPAGDINDGTC
jgi:hypothetical protein